MKKSLSPKETPRQPIAQTMKYAKVCGFMCDLQERY
jgi:hypothetical protein